MIFVPAESSYGGIPSTNGVIDLANPYLGGFGFSRPKATDPDRSRDTDAPKQITLDFYHHLSKRFYPEIRYLQAFDLYSYVQYSLLNLVISTYQRHLESTDKVAPNSGSFSSRHLLTEFYSLVSAQSSSKLVCGNRLKLFS